MTRDRSVESLAELRNRPLNSMLLGTALVALPAVAISIWRMATLGSQPLMLLHIGLTGTLWLLWLMRAAIAYAVRATALLVVYWVTGVAGYLQLGPAAVGGVFLLLLVIAGMLFLSRRTGWWLVAAVEVGRYVGRRR